MPSIEPKICKLQATGTTRDITLTIPETLEIIRKPGSATSQSVIMAVHKIGLLTIYGIQKHKKRSCLTNVIFNNLAPLWVQDKINSTVQEYGIGLAFGTHLVDMDCDYMDIKIYFHLLCNYLQTNPSSADPPSCPPPQK
jgi:hypothetical protein